MLRGEFDGFLDILRRSGVDPDDRDAPLLAWNAERSVKVASLDCPIGKGVGLPVGVFSSTRLIRTPDTIVPASEDIRAVS